VNSIDETSLTPEQIEARARVDAILLFNSVNRLTSKRERSFWLWWCFVLGWFIGHALYH
jgi:hypothetical protein